MLTAEDVAFTYNTLRDTSSVNDFTMLKEAEAVDGDTVVFHMNRPIRSGLTRWRSWELCQSMPTVRIMGENPIGSGRYVLKQWDKGQQVILEANPDYYGEAPKMKKVTILFMEEDAAFAAAQSGQVDLAYTAAPYAEQKIDGFELLSFATVDNRGFNLPAISRKEGAEVSGEDGLPIGNDFTSDVNVRRAINLAIDRDAMIEHVLSGYGSPAYSVCDKMPWYNEMSQTAYDPETAAELLDKAGWKTGADGIREKNGVRAAFPLLYPASDSVRQALAADTANQLKGIGIEVTIEGVGWDEPMTESE
mgnify:FL=1